MWDVTGWTCQEVTGKKPISQLRALFKGFLI